MSTRTRAPPIVTADQITEKKRKLFEIRVFFVAQKTYANRETRLENHENYPSAWCRVTFTRSSRKHYHNIIDVVVCTGTDYTRISIIHMHDTCTVIWKVNLVFTLLNLRYMVKCFLNISHRCLRDNISFIDSSDLNVCVWNVESEIIYILKKKIKK